MLHVAPWSWRNVVSLHCVLTVYGWSDNKANLTWLEVKKDSSIRNISEAEPLQCLLCSNRGKEKLEHTREASNVLGSSLPQWSSRWAVNHGQMNTQIQAEEVHFPRPVSGLIVSDRVRSLVIQESRASPKCWKEPLSGFRHFKSMSPGCLLGEVFPTITTKRRPQGRARTR